MLAAHSWSGHIANAHVKFTTSALTERVTALRSSTAQQPYTVASQWAMSQELNDSTASVHMSGGLASEDARFLRYQIDCPENLIVVDALK